MVSFPDRPLAIDPVYIFGCALNRALRGERNGAIEQLQRYVSIRYYPGEFVPVSDAQRYLEALRAGKDPFTSEELTRLQDLFRLRF
ncbi:hypothetical protein SBA6_410073 [Candidatus Sulfopaludibacter sp. SbA6]|nr:hypothetical protein SBA6_410073 [Candidatus Sulfopaludibacter sp. SbA6]